MKTIWILLFSVLSIPVISQSKGDYQWLIGTDGSSDEGIQINHLNFKDGVLDKSLETFPFRMNAGTTSICSDEGALLFYTNGTAIGNMTGDKMLNGDSINAGPFLFDFIGYEEGLWGYPGPQNILILPDPACDQGYYIIHKPQSYFPDSTVSIFTEEMRYSYVDMSLENGLGAVTEKNQTVMLGEKILVGYLTAINRTDTEDWWLLQPKEETSEIMTFFIDSTGIHRRPDQEIDHTYHWNASASGSARFSPDGQKYAYYNINDELLLFDFDRQSGVLSGMQKLEVHDTIVEVGAFSSVEWSPNSRFLYVSVMTKLYQIDTWENDLEDGLELIDTYNGSLDPYENNLYFMVLGPDCKIYMCSTNGNRSYHLIRNPDEKGQACNFEQGAFSLPSWGVGYLPNFPRLRVDDTEKCNPNITSMFGELVHYNKDLKVYPNPAVNLFTIDLPGKYLEGYLRIIDLDGRLVLEQEVADGLSDLTVNISHFNPGYYVVEYLPKENPKRYIFTSSLLVVK